MTRIPPLAALLLAALASPAATQTNTAQYEATAHPDAVDQTTQASQVQFRNDRYLRMTVPVRVAGSGPYRFLIDTGADRTAISTDLARRLRLTESSGAILHSVTGMQQVGTATVPMLDLAAKRVTNLDAALLEAHNMGADGILGLDSLRSQKILFDFKEQTLTVVPAETRLPKDDGTIVVTGRIRNGRLVLTEARADDHRVTVVVDTGSEVSIANDALRRRLVRARRNKPGTVELMSVTGEKLTGDYLFVRQLEIGGVTLKDLPVVFADSHAFRKLELEKRPAILLGMNALRGFEKVSIDFARKKLRVVLPEEGSLGAAQMASR